MSLKPGRLTLETEIDYFATNTMEKGGIVSVSTLGSGEAMDQGVQVAHYATTQSGARPIGILLNDVVNLDLTRVHQNWHKDEVQVNGKVTVMRKGWVVTNMITSGITVSAGDQAYLDQQGLITNVNTGAVASPRIGDFGSKKDENGFAKIHVNLP